MGQANSAQREPSMEEILASIRKIIEETDKSRQDAEDGAAAPAYLEPESDGDFEHAAAFDAAPAQSSSGPKASEPDLAAFREAIAGSRTAEAVPPVRPEAVEEPESRPFTLADVQRRLSGARAAEAQPERAPAPMVVDDEPELTRHDPVFDDTDAVEFGSQEHEDEPEMAEAASVEAERPVNAVPAAPSPLQPTELDNGLQRPSIISAAAGRQVAGAFDELKDAFMASRKKSFDDMAEEMMKPMLQDWLDNNLPILVERMVREEIERIARG